MYFNVFCPIITEYFNFQATNLMKKLNALTKKYHKKTGLSTI